MQEKRSVEIPHSVEDLVKLMESRTQEEQRIMGAMIVSFCAGIGYGREEKAG